MAPMVVRNRDGWWWWHCRQCLRTSPDRVLTWATAVEVALTHLDTRHGRRTGFSAPALEVNAAGYPTGGMVQVVKTAPVPMRHPVSAEHPPVDFDG